MSPAVSLAQLGELNGAVELKVKLYFHNAGLRVPHEWGISSYKRIKEAAADRPKWPL